MKKLLTALLIISASLTALATPEQDAIRAEYKLKTANFGYTRDLSRSYEAITHKPKSIETVTVTVTNDLYKGELIVAGIAEFCGLTLPLGLTGDVDIDNALNAKEAEYMDAGNMVGVMACAKMGLNALYAYNIMGQEMYSFSAPSPTKTIQESKEVYGESYAEKQGWTELLSGGYSWYVITVGE